MLGTALLCSSWLTCWVPSRDWHRPQHFRQDALYTQPQPAGLVFLSMAVSLCRVNEAGFCRMQLLLCLGLMHVCMGHICSSKKTWPAPEAVCMQVSARLNMADMSCCETNTHLHLAKHKGKCSRDIAELWSSSLHRLQTFTV